MARHPGQRLRLGLAAALALVLVAACARPTGAPSPSPSVRPTPTPTPQPLVAVVEPGSPDDTLVLITLQGRQIAQTLISRAAVIAGTTATEVAYEDHDELRALQSDGQVVTLGSMEGFKGGRVVLSPDGKQWMWSTYDEQPGAEVHSFVYLNETLVADDVLQGRFFEPVAWTARGVVFEAALLGSGTAQPFDLVTGPTLLLQPARQQAGSPPRGEVLTGPSCLYADLAADGSTVCRVPGASVIATASLQFGSLAGGPITVPLPQPGFAAAGAISFAPSRTGSPNAAPAEAVVGGSDLAGGPGAATGATYTTAIVNLATHALTALPTAGLRPGAGSWAWLSATQLIAYRPPGAVGGAAGVYIASAVAQAALLWPEGTPVGLLDQGGGGGGGESPSPTGSPSPASEV